MSDWLLDETVWSKYVIVVLCNLLLLSSEKLNLFPSVLVWCAAITPKGQPHLYTLIYEEIRLSQDLTEWEIKDMGMRGNGRLFTVLAVFLSCAWHCSTRKEQWAELAAWIGNRNRVAAAAICPPVLGRRKVKWFWCDFAQEGPGKHGVHPNYCTNFFTVSDRKSCFGIHIIWDFSFLALKPPLNPLPHACAGALKVMLRETNCWALQRSPVRHPPVCACLGQCWTLADRSARIILRGKSNKL